MNVMYHFLWILELFLHVSVKSVYNKDVIQSFEDAIQAAKQGLLTMLPQKSNALFISSALNALISQLRT